MNKCVHTVTNANFSMISQALALSPAYRVAFNSIHTVPRTVGLHKCTRPYKSISTSCQASLIPDFKGGQYSRDTNDEEYQTRRYQYATSSHKNDGHMNPHTILYPKDLDDIKLAVKYARSEK